jgi:dATP/dGTP diphosphohydrolase
MGIKDSGTRQEYPSGAVRDMGEKKGRADLMPLVVIGKLMQDDVLQHIGAYMKSGNTNEIDSALECFVLGNKAMPFEGESTAGKWGDAMIELSLHFEEGALKYDPRNWEKGISVHTFIDSGVRHYLKYLRGDDDEPHDRAFLWNLVCLIWTHHHRPECIDIDFE